MKPIFKIIFMGTPDFAVPALETLHHSEHEVSLVVTQPDRPKGRGRKLAFSPVKTKAIELQCPISQPQSLRENFLCDELKKYQPDLLVVVAFGHVLSKEILSIARFRTMASGAPCQKRSKAADRNTINHLPVKLLSNGLRL